jgi:hypothetical protein
MRIAIATASQRTSPKYAAPRITAPIAEDVKIRFIVLLISFSSLRHNLF